MNIDNNILFYLLMAMVCMNFLRSGSMIMLILNIYLLACSGRILKISRISGLYILLTVSIVLYAIAFSSLNDGVKALNYAMCFLMGYHGFYLSRNGVRFIHKIILAMTAGYLLYIVMVMIHNITFITTLRLMKDIWTDTYVSVTLLAALSSVVMAVSIYALFFEEKKSIKMLGVGGLATVLILNFRTATRTPFVLLVLILMLVLYLQAKKANNKKKVRLFIGLCLLIAAIGVAYVLDLFSIRTAWESSFLWQRFLETDSDSRIRIAIQHLRYALDYPFGGRQLSAFVGKSGHNAVQDFYDSYGMLAGAFYFAITISQLHTLKVLMRQKNWQKQDILLIIVLFTISIQMWTEPLVTGYPIYIWTMCFLHGITCAYLEKRKTLVAE